MENTLVSAFAFTLTELICNPVIDVEAPIVRTISSVNAHSPKDTSLIRLFAAIAFAPIVVHFGDPRPMPSIEGKSQISRISTSVTSGPRSIDFNFSNDRATQPIVSRHIHQADALQRRESSQITLI